MDEEYVPCAGQNRPLIVLDGANIIYASPLKKTLSPLISADLAFRNMGFPVVSVLPMSMEQIALGDEELSWFQSARAFGALMLAPCRTRGDDDIFAVGVAVHNNGYLVSNDRLSDHVESLSFAAGVKPNEVSSWIESRTITFAWAGSHFCPHPLAAAMLLKDVREHPSELGSWGPLQAPTSATMLLKDLGEHQPQFVRGGPPHGGATVNFSAPTSSHFIPSVQPTDYFTLGGQPYSTENEVPRLFSSPNCCFRCGEEGHISRNCSKPKTWNIDCWSCGEKGHLSRECPQKQAKF